MRLTTMTDYALRLLIYLGQHPERLCTTGEVAQAYGISEAHLTKITHQLGQHGWISTVRGKGGGMKLALPPAELMLGDLVRSVESDFYLVECLGAANSCNLTGMCSLTGIVNAALAAFMAELDRHSLADLLRRPSGAKLSSIVSLPKPRRASSLKPPVPLGEA
ncbi:RrF2 family transcriptional regulator [Roseateles oligotrophus]|uniref:Rrf2 family transcriptional regulator n=1 Tax=Roseateles oligotrophus TaxID=1769250 RepID=A0ABT2YEG9_9BURK|nr:Rrf2 family transcriptional regulator [Roseateles oligotrophus]MCV2368452.1 Rrf2 family transcriptional regulator [Roseateles oligotrophus]